MIHFKRLTYKNFLAAGNNPITIQLDKSKSTLIVGANGAGKSTILDALSFALFGKAHRSVPKAGLLNAVNGKHGEVTVEFNTAGHDFKIIRGIKPNKFEVWQDGSMIDQSASVRDYQKFLEQNILKLNHKSFHQIVVLGSSSFIPFMQLNSNHRREVIEDLLDINIFSKMKGILRDKNQQTKQKASNAKIALDNQKSKIEYQKKHIRHLDDINKSAKASNDVAINTLKEDIKSLNSKLVASDDDVKGWPDSINTLTTTRDDLNQHIGVCKHDIKKLATKGQFFEENDICPTCTQTIDDDLKHNMLDVVQQDATKVISKMKDAELEFDNAVETLKLIHEVQLDHQNIVDQISQKSVELEGIQNLTTTHADVKEPVADLYALMNTADEYREDLDKHTEALLYNDIASEMLKDTGIRTKVIREYLPAMNTLINQYLQTLDFFVAFHLDENFQETIKSRHRDSFVYANFSEGEKMRIDLSLLFAWRQIAKMKNSTNTNLLILDETFDSSLDIEGVDNLMKILFTLDKDTNTFIISHKPDMLDGKMKSKIEFKKINNFSRIA
jgi:DNA repair exonuclease SbcCD ATPase subunit